MLSVIICSANADDLRLVKENIAATIGIPHEIIAIDNRGASRGICDVYNEGARLANFDLLCFMHEDIALKTKDWGTKVADIFQKDEKIGVLGVAGGGYKSLAPCGWYQIEFHSEERSYQNVLQGYKRSEKPDFHAYHNPRNENLSRVVCVDGLWFCTQKKIAVSHPFDSKMLKGFHGYDLDFCLNVFPHHHIMVTFEILMRHASEGNFSKQWLDEILKVHRKWSPVLPITTSALEYKQDYFTELRAFQTVIDQMLEWDYSFFEIQKMLLYSLRSRKMRKKLFFKSYQYLLRAKQHPPLPPPD
jgi:hypothetical protein